MVEMAMQQLAAASPKVMGQRPELKFVNEQGETGRPDLTRPAHGGQQLQGDEGDRLSISIIGIVS